MSVQTTDQAMLIALSHHQSGNLAEAEKIYRGVLSREPANASAMQLLGVIELQKNRLDAAIDLIRRAISIAPAVADFHLNLGTALHNKGKFDEAASAYRQALQLDPRSAKAHNNLGNALREMGSLNEAIAHYRQAIQLDPAYAAAYNHLAIALTTKGELDEAIACCRKAIGLEPRLATAHIHLGVALSAKKQYDDAIAAYREAIRLDPSLPEAHSNLANALIEVGKPGEAIESYRRAIALKPNFAGAWINLALASAHQGDLDDAISAARTAIRLAPYNPQHYLNLFYFLYHHPDYDGPRLSQETRQWTSHLKPLPVANTPVADTPSDYRPTRHRSPDRRLKIGYLSTFFRACADVHFIHPLLAHHDHQSFEIFGYPMSDRPEDEFSQRLQSHCDHWTHLRPLGTRAAVELIRQHELDILINISRPADDCDFLLVNRLAPIQMARMTFGSGTTGLNTIDYRISDSHVDPTDADRRSYCEETLLLPVTAWCYDPLMELPPVNNLPALTNGHITFGSFNRFHKINDAVVAAWAQVLQTVADSRIVIFAPFAVQRHRLVARFREAGIDPARIDFLDEQPRNEFMKQYARVDFVLDTFPFAGHTTSMDALCMGIPFVTLTGRTCVARMGAAILQHLGMQNLIAQDVGQYVSIATSLSQNLAALAEIRAGLRAKVRQSPLMDGPSFVRDLEAAYRRLWQDWCQKQQSA